MSKLVLPDQMNYGEAYNPCMEMTTQEQATEYLTALIERDMRLGYCKTTEEAHKMELSNIGYVAGYYSTETRIRVNQLFGAVHPIFGNNYSPTASEALEAGKKLAKGD